MKTKASIAVILAGILWGCITLFVRRLSAAGLTSMQIALARLAVSAVLFSLFLLIRDPSRFRIALKDLWMFIGTGIVSLDFFITCYFYTMVHGQASIAVVLLYTSPVFVMLFSAVLFREAITRRKLLALCLTVAGCVFVSGILSGSLSMRPLVFLSGIASGLLYALYTIFGRYALKKYDTLTVTAYTFLFAFIGALFLGDPAGLTQVLRAQPGLLLPLVGIAFVSTVLPYLLYTWGLQHIDSGKAAILVAVEPVVGSVIGMTVFGEPHDFAKLIGIGLIIAAIITLNTGGFFKKD
jgi:drug/metabolite transporter (DMT)-like permease